MKRSEFIPLLKERVESITTPYLVVDEESWSFRMRPKIKWELQDEYFEFWIGTVGEDIQFRFRYVDDYVFSLPDSLRKLDYGLLIIRQSTADVLDGLLANESQTLTETLADNVIGFARTSLADGIQAANRIISLGAGPRIEDFHFMLEKWLARPACIHFIRLMVHHFPESVATVERVGALMGVSNLVRNVLAARELA